MRRRWIVSAAVVLAVATVQPAVAQTPEPALGGSWLLDSERSQTPQQALEAVRGAAGGGMAMRGGGGGGGGVMIRGDGPGGGIMGVLQGGQQLRLEFTAEQVTIRVDDAAPVIVPLNGEAKPVDRWEQQVRARARLADGVLTVETSLPNGGVVTEVFSAAAGDLSVELRMPLPMRGAGAEPPILTLKRVYTPGS